MAHDSGSHGRLVDGRYRLGEPLGRGGMGTVWLAFDELLRRDVAVKEVRIPDDLDEMETQGRCERALREARAAARITHPNVVTIFDVAEDDGRPWIVMELVRAPSLTDVLEEGRMAPHEAAEVGLAVLAALRAARAADVLHRDVKPSNILMAPGGRIVLTDFGIATVAGSVTLTATGMLVGSPEYLAPERVLGRRPGPASDLWSLGVTLYQAVEGFSPFRRTGAMDTLSAVLTDEPAPPRQSGALWPAIEALLRKDPLERADEDDTERLLMAAMVSGGAPVAQEPGAEPIPPGTATVEDPGGVRGVTRSSWQQAPQSPETPRTAQVPPPIWQQEPPVSPVPPFGAVSRADPGGATGGYPLTGSHAHAPADAVHGSETADDRPNPVLIGAATGAAGPGDRAAKKRRKTILLGGMVAAAVTALAIWVPAAMGGQGGNGGDSDTPGRGGSSQGASAAANPQGTGNRSDVLRTTGSSAGTGQSGGAGTSGNSSQGGGSTRTSRPTTSNTGNPSTSRPPTSRPPTTTSPPRTTAPATTRPPIDPSKGGGGASGAPPKQGGATAAN